MMSRNVRGFMSLFRSDKPVICKVHGYCVAGGTDMALCSDLLVVEDRAKIGYPPARVWGVPTTALWAHRIGPTRAKRLLLTGDSIDGHEAVEWGLASEAAPAAELDARFEALLERVARLPVNQLVMHKLLVNQTLVAQGLAGDAGAGHLLRRDRPPHARGLRRSQRRAAEAGFKEAVRERDEPFGDFGLAAPTGPREGPDHQLADAVRARHGAPARRRRARGLRRRRLRAGARQPLEVPERRTSSTRRRATETEAFIDDVERILTEHAIDVVVPAFEEAFYLSTQLDRLTQAARRSSPRRSRRSRACTTSRPSRSSSRELGLPIPETVVATSDEELAAAIERFPQYFGRAVFSRGGVDLLTNTGPLAGALSIRPTCTRRRRSRGWSSRSSRARRSAPTRPSTTAR